jgi:hypothetical protein
MKKIKGKKAKAIFIRNSNRTKRPNLGGGKVRRGGLYF